MNNYAGTKDQNGTVPSNPGHVSSDYKASPRRRETRTVPSVRLPGSPSTSQPRISQAALKDTAQSVSL